jgi:hypothetical protein
VCARCHAADIEGAKRTDSRGLAFLQLPGLDLEGLRKRRVPIGEWPEFAEARVPPVTDVLLSSDETYRAARPRLLKADLTDLADPGHDADVQALVWSFKALIDDLKSGGESALKRRLDAALGVTLTDEQARALTGLLPTAAIDEAQREWFPHLGEELQRHRSGAATPLVPVRVARPKEKAQEAAPSKETSASFDSLFAGGLLGASEPPKGGAQPPPPEAQKPAVMNTEQRMSLGGWYRDEDALRYRPAGHADAFMKGWIDAARAMVAFEAMADPKKTAGACTKCHSVDEAREGAAVVNWRAARGDPKRHPFTVFSHVKHFSMIGQKGCSTCHVLDRKADYASAFKARDPGRFSSNFATLRRGLCLECHTPAKAGDDCTLCHRYHVGEFSPTLPPAMLDKM